MGKILLGILLTLMVLGLLPFALIARGRASQSPNLPLHLIIDMAKQPKFRPQRGTPLFADNRSMRPQIEGTVALEDLGINSELLNDSQHPGRIMNFDGKDSLEFTDISTYAAVMYGRVRPATMTDEQFAAVKPPDAASDAAIAADTTFYVKRIPAVFTVSPEFIHRGQERFNIYCSPCHGEAGMGDGAVAAHATILRATPGAITGWVDPQNLTVAKIQSRTDGSIFNTITHGVRNMPAYESQITIPDRWAIVAYVRALEISANPPASATQAAH